MGRASLRSYEAKRDFGRSPEPRGGKERSDAHPRFVVQKHDASRLHYDLRLEVDGVLKSWAVPKGPSTDPRQKRLAVATEDHPLDYATFEGVIPEGNYGAGTVLVWDLGTFENLTESAEKPVPPGEALEAGHIVVRLSGEKLRGAYALTRMGDRRSKQWLLVKVRDEDADARRNPVSTEPESVLTGKTLEDFSTGSEEAS